MHMHLFDEKNLPCSTHELFGIQSGLKEKTSVNSTDFST